MLKISNFITILLCVNIAFAQCPKPVTHLTKDTPAPCEGYLFSPEAEKSARQAKENEKFYQGVIEDYKTLDKKQDERSDVLTKQIMTMQGINSNLESQLSQEKSFLNKALYVAGGALAIIFIRNNVR